MEHDESFYYKALGLEPPAAEGAGGNEPDVAEPAGISAEAAAADDSPAASGPDGEDAGGNEPETAEPAEGEAGEEGKPPTQTKEERARFAAQRRQQEQQAAIDAALREQREQIDKELGELFNWAGFKDGTSSIESLEQFREFRERTELSQLQKDLQAGKMTPDQLRTVIAQEIQKQQPAPPAENRDDGFEAAMQAEMAEIARYDPEIKTPEDLLKLDRFQQFRDQVQNHGHSFLEAYRFVYADKIAETQADQAARAAAQRTKNSIRSKDHLRPAGAKGEGGELPQVPADVFRTYKAMMPGMSAEDIARDYAKYLKRK